MRFRERSRLHDEVRGEATGADGEAAARCPGPAKVIGEGGRTEQQVFGGGVAASYWKTMPAGLVAERGPCLTSKLPRTG